MQSVTRNSAQTNIYRRGHRRETISALTASDQRIQRWQVVPSWCNEVGGRRKSGRKCWRCSAARSACVGEESIDTHDIWPGVELLPSRQHPTGTSKTHKMLQTKRAAEKSPENYLQKAFSRLFQLSNWWLVERVIATFGVSRVDIGCGNSAPTFPWRLSFFAAATAVAAALSGLRTASTTCRRFRQNVFGGSTGLFGSATCSSRVCTSSSFIIRFFRFF